jgi:glucose/arabinose dehydrogenase
MRRSTLVLFFLALLSTLSLDELLVQIVVATAEAQIDLDPVLEGLTNPLYLTNARDGSGRLFLVEQDGRIQVLQPGATAPTFFLDITSKVLSGGERGLLGLAFHPQFKYNRRFFVDYTRMPDGATIVAEYHVSASNPDGAETNEVVLLTIPQPFANHNGGMIEFGPDGFLYIGMGDGGSGNDPSNRAQNTQELLGKILRIDVDHPESPSQPYSSPSGNPFLGPDPGRDEIFALGFRNPWRFSFDRATGQLYVGDVGQGDREEIDIVTLGGNYGWRVFEGTRCTDLGPAACGVSGFIPPLAEYDHSGGRCAVTGGYVYRGKKSSLPLGAYVYGDFCTGEIFMLNNGVQSLLLDTDLNIASFGEDEGGEVYVVGLGGTVHRISNPLPQEFVSRLYQEVLNRQPDPAGLQSFVAQIQQFGSVVPTVFAFFHSAEFLGRNTTNEQFLTILYHTFLDREPDPAGFSAFLGALQGGQLTRDNLIDIFLDSAEFAALASFLPPQDPVTAFVTTLYVRILGRGPDLPGLQGFVAQLQQSRTVLPTVLFFLHSAEFLARNTSDTEYVTLLYRVLLDRIPDAAGLAGWVALLTQGTATRDQLVAQFAASPEFQTTQHQLFP